MSNMDNKINKSTSIPCLKEASNKPRSLPYPKAFISTNKATKILPQQIKHRKKQIH